VGFSLGLASNKPVVRLTRLMGANEEDLRRQAQVKLIEKTRQAKREEVVAQNRLKIISPQAEKPIEIIDLLENDSSDEGAEGSNTEDYFYFLARKHGKYLVDPLSADTPDFEF